MIADLMTKADFVEATKVDWNIRWRSMRAIGNAVETAHEAIGADNQYVAVANIVKKIYAWKVDYKTSKPTSNWKASRRADGVMALERQIGRLFTTTFVALHTAAQRTLTTKLTRARQNFSRITGIGAENRPALRFPNQTRSLSSQEYVYEFLEPQHRANATQLSHQWLASEDDVSFREYVQNLGLEYLRDLDNMNGKVRVGEDEQYKWVQYLSAEQRADYELKPIGLNRFSTRPARTP